MGSLHANVDKLTDIVEEAMYKEFGAISERGGLLGATDTRTSAAGSRK